MEKQQSTFNRIAKCRNTFAAIVYFFVSIAVVVEAALILPALEFGTDLFQAFVAGLLGSCF